MKLRLGVADAKLIRRAARQRKQSMNFWMGHNLIVLAQQQLNPLILKETSLAEDHPAV